MPSSFTLASQRRRGPGLSLLDLHLAACTPVTGHRPAGSHGHAQVASTRETSQTDVKIDVKIDG